MDLSVPISRPKAIVGAQFTKGPPGEAERSSFSDLRSRLKTQGEGPK